MSKVFTITEGLENLGALRTGGQGSVYKGRRTGAIYSAVKLIPTPIYTEDQNDKNYRNFLNEVGKLQKVNEIPNPNIVKILSSGITESGSFPFIEMEYIDGPDLGELLQPPHEKIFMLKELLKVADQLACALAHCHKVGVKHGDIKSNNVKYNIHSGNYVLLDFGLAIMSEEQRRSSIRHAGAIEFMAPEQHEGKMLLETDVYSYGVILYELLTGQVPFPLHGDGDTGRNTVMVAHMETEIPDALKLRQSNLPDSWTPDKKAQEMQVPAWLLNLIYKCLQKNPQDRYPSGVELHDAVSAGSLATVGAVTDTAGIAALKSENERLQQEVLSLQQNTPAADQETVDGSKMVVPKAVFWGLVTLMILFMVFSVYAAFIKRSAPAEPVTNEDSLQLKTDTGTLSGEQPAEDPAAVDSYNRRRAADSIKNSIDSVVKAEKAKQNTKPKPAPADSTDETVPDTTIKPETF